jgi:hypothetical protein
VHLYSQKDYIAIVKDTEKYHLIAPKKILDEVIGKINAESFNGQPMSLITPDTHVLVAHKPKFSQNEIYTHDNNIWTMVLLQDTRVDVFKNAKVILFDNAIADLFNMSSAICFDKSMVAAHDFSRCFALDDSRVHGENYSTTYLFDNAKIVTKKELGITHMDNLRDKDNPNVQPTIICCGKTAHAPVHPDRKLTICYDTYLIQEMKLIFESNRKLKNHITPDIVDRLK